MHTEGNENVFQLLSTHKIGAFFGTGFLRGVDAGSCTAVLNGRGIELPAMWASSTGGPAAFYHATGQASIGVTVYLEECLTDAFLSKSPARLRSGTSMDAYYLTKDVFARGSKKLNLDALAEYGERGTIRLGITNYDDGTGEWVDPLTAREGPMEALTATIAAPGFFRTPVMVNGRRRIDGGIACPFPDRRIIDSCEGWIIFANAPNIEKKDSRKTRIAAEVIGRTLPEKTRHALHARHDLYRERVQYLRRSGKPYCILWSDPRIGMFTRDPVLLNEVYVAYKKRMHDILDRAGL